LISNKHHRYWNIKFHHLPLLTFSLYISVLGAFLLGTFHTFKCRDYREQVCSVNFM